jgi:hypothetical protein
LPPAGFSLGASRLLHISKFQNDSDIRTEHPKKELSAMTK